MSTTPTPAPVSSNTGPRTKVDKALMDKEFVSQEVKSQCLATAIYSCSKTHPFLGSVLQCLNISYTHTLPTAGVAFNNDAKRWDMFINPFFYCKKLSEPERKAVLMHELNHITHKHPMRVPFLKISARKRMLMNIAADMAINQFIKDIPKGCSDCKSIPIEQFQGCKNELCPGRCIDVFDYYDTDEKTGARTQWPVNKTMEFYYEKLCTRFQDPEEEDGDGEGDSEGNGSDGKGKSKGNAGGGADHGSLPQTIDEHMWDGSGDEKDMLEATEDLVKRAMVKARLSYDDLPGHIKDLLEELKARRAELNYKALILAAMKKHAAGHNRKNTWTRPNRRFGNIAPGTKVGDLPKLHLALDTSGSISTEELNEFLEIVDQFLKVGARKCNLTLFHTAQYYSEEYKINTKLEKSKVESGGTELTETMADIWKRRPDLSIVITDGCYGNVDVEKWMKPGQKWPETLFIISEGGSEDHPLARLGMTVKVPAGARKK